MPCMPQALLGPLYHLLAQNAPWPAMSMLPLKQACCEGHAGPEVPWSLPSRILAHTGCKIST